MKQFFFSSGILLAMSTLSLFSCKKGMIQENVDKSLSRELPQASLTPSDFTKLADEIEARFKNNVVGYSFVVSYQNTNILSRSGGKSRAYNDILIKNMTASEMYSIASVSKTITAAALLRAMADNNVHLNQSIYGFLPAHWQKGGNIGLIRFRDLLDHSSGLSNNNAGADYCEYQDLKKVVAAGVQQINMKPFYNNRNYALMRILIPQIAKYNITPWLNAYPPFLLPTIENMQAGEYANGYKDYCRKVIFSKMLTTGGSVIDCKNTVANPGLYYPPPGLSATGKIAPDLTMKAGGEGWVLTTSQMADFMRTLHYSESILPKTISESMKTDLLGYDVYSSVEGVTYWHKNGIYMNDPMGSNFGYRSLIIGFGDGVSVAVMTNSTRVLQFEVLEAYKKWHL